MGQRLGSESANSGVVGISLRRHKPLAEKELTAENPSSVPECQGGRLAPTVAHRPLRSSSGHRRDNAGAPGDSLVSGKRLHSPCYLLSQRQRVVYGHRLHGITPIPRATKWKACNLSPSLQPIGAAPTRHETYAGTPKTAPGATYLPGCNKNPGPQCPSRPAEKVPCNTTGGRGPVL